MLPTSDASIPPATPVDYHPLIRQVFAEMGKVVVGQQSLLNRLLIGLFTGGHILLEGVPGLAKTLTISTLAKVLHLHFQRVQFTPDLLPSDLVGTMIYNQNESIFEVRRGRFSPISCWPTKSTARLPRCRAPCSKPCRKSR